MPHFYEETNVLGRLTGYVTLAALLLACPAVSWAETVGRGDMEFFLDTAAFRNDDGTTRQELYLRIPNIGIRYKEVDGKPQGRIRLSIEVRRAEGEAVVDESSELTFNASSEKAAMSPLFFQTLTRTYTLDEGVYRLNCAIEDLNAPKITIVGMIQRRVKTSVVSGYPLEVPRYPDQLMSVSDAKFLWNLGAPASPNPPRLYGLYKDSLRVYVEAYVPVEMTLEALHLKTVIVDELGQPIREASVAVPASAGTEPGLRTLPILVTEDLNQLAAGSYTLFLNASHGDELLVRRLCGKFQIAWDMRTWESSRRSFEYEARFLLDGPNEFDDFMRLNVGEQEAMLAKMWKEIDPDPTTGVNEAYEEFTERLEYVNAKYTDYQLGLFTDRGLIFLKYGPPDEKIVDVIPLNRESLSDAMEKVEDKYHPVNFSNTGGRVGYPKPPPDVDPRRLGVIGEGGNEGYPYELWLYNGGGEPLLARDRAMEADIGLRFIFVDKEGFGRYRLESSSSMANK